MMYYRQISVFMPVSMLKKKKERYKLDGLNFFFKMLSNFFIKFLLLDNSKLDLFFK